MIVIGQLFVYAPLVNRIGPQRAVMWGSRLAVPFVALWPLLGLAASSSGPVKWSVLAGAMLLRSVAGLLQGTSTFMVVSNSVPASSLGSLNGAAQTISSLGRTVGPALGGIILAWSLQGRHPWPLNIFAVYNFVAVILVVVYFVAASLPAHVNHVRGQHIGRK